MVFQLGRNYDLTPYFQQVAPTTAAAAAKAVAAKAVAAKAAAAKAAAAKAAVAVAAAAAVCPSLLFLPKSRTLPGRPPPPPPLLLNILQSPNTCEC